MWAPILYKAMAKAYGSYNNFSMQADSINPLKMLTGAPVFNINLDQNADVAANVTAICTDTSFKAMFMAFPVYD